MIILADCRSAHLFSRERSELAAHLLRCFDLLIRIVGAQPREPSHCCCCCCCCDPAATKNGHSLPSLQLLCSARLSSARLGSMRPTGGRRELHNERQQQGRRMDKLKSRAQESETFHSAELAGRRVKRCGRRRAESPEKPINRKDSEPRSQFDFFQPASFWRHSISVRDS